MTQYRELTPQEKAMMASYRNLFKSETGKKVLTDMMKAHHFYEATYTGNPDPLALAFAEGQRNVILRIIALINSKEEDYVSGYVTDRDDDVNYIN